MMKIINQAHVRMGGLCNIQHLKKSHLKQSLFALLPLGIVVSFLPFVSCSNSIKTEEKSEQSSKLIESLSLDEREELKFFFHNLFAEEALGYTLFGDKPMSFCFPCTYPPTFSKRSYFFKLYIEGTKPFAKALSTWKKLKATNSNNNYSLIIYEEKKYPVFVILINKPAFLDILNKNIDVLQHTFGSSVTAMSFLKDLEEKKIQPEELFQHHLLLGTILGYGRHSAELFQRRRELISKDAKPPFSLNQQIPSIGFSSVEAEIQYITERLKARQKVVDWYTHTSTLFLRVTRVAFASDPEDPEAQSLIKKYKALHATLTSLFDQEDWLEVVLSQLCSK